MGGLTAWQALFVHSGSPPASRCWSAGASSKVGHIAVQLARHAGAEVVESGPVDLVFDTRGGEIPAGERVVTIVEEVPGATYFVVDRHRATAGVRGRVGGRPGELRPEIDSVFALTEARARSSSVASPGKRGKVVLEGGGGPPLGDRGLPSRTAPLGSGRAGE